MKMNFCSVGFHEQGNTGTAVSLNALLGLFMPHAVRAVIDFKSDRYLIQNHYRP
jgi:hypothetical protein